MSNFDDYIVDKKSIKLLKQLSPNRLYLKNDVERLLYYGMIAINPIFEEEGDGDAQYDITIEGKLYLEYLAANQKKKHVHYFEYWFPTLIAFMSLLIALLK